MAVCSRGGTGDLWGRDCARVQELGEEIRSLLLQREKSAAGFAGQAGEQRRLLSNKTKNAHLVGEGGVSPTDSKALSASPSSSSDAGKSSALLRGKLLQFTQEIDQLEHSLEMHKRESGGRDGACAEELRRKEEFLRRMIALKEQLRQAFDKTHSSYFSDQSTKTGIGLGNSGVSGVSRLGDLLRRDEDEEGGGGGSSGRAGSKRVLLEREEDVLLALQDDQLSFLEGTVSNLKNIGYSVGDEVDVHRKLLNGLDEEVDLTQTALEKNKKLLKQIIDRQSTTCLLLTAIFLAIVLVFLIVTTS